MADIEAVIRSVRIHPRKLDWRYITVAVNSQGQVIGCAQIKPANNGNFELTSVAVAGDWQGRGVPLRMGRHIVAHLNGRLWGTCMDSMASFYKRFGGVEVSDPKQIPSFLKGRQRWVNLFLRLTGREGRLIVMVLDRGE
ncbi:MAG: GNAT family N-acetyltransferase [Deltaproteobacteria bacterium]|nr:GNAT family N-acetyltransferase [Deltaproteobacteria bacterium]